MKSVKYILSLGLAVGFGMAVGMLTAPSTGKKTRKKLKGEYDEVKGSLEDAASKKLKEAKSIIKREVDKQKSQGKDAFSRIKEAVKI